MISSTNHCTLDYLVIATCSNFSAALLYAINQLGKPNLSFKKEHIFSIVAIHNGKDVFVWLPQLVLERVCVSKSSLS